MYTVAMGSPWPNFLSCADCLLRRPEHDILAGYPRSCSLSSTLDRDRTRIGTDSRRRWCSITPLPQHSSCGEAVFLFPISDRCRLSSDVFLSPCHPFTPSPCHQVTLSAPHPCLTPVCVSAPAACLPRSGATQSQLRAIPGCPPILPDPVCCQSRCLLAVWVLGFLLDPPVRPVCSRPRAQVQSPSSSTRSAGDLTGIGDRR